MIAPENPHDALMSVQRIREGRPFAPAVGIEDDVGSQQVHEIVCPASTDGLEEPMCQLLASLSRGFESWLPLLDMPPRSDGDLSAVLLGLADDVGDLVEPEVEHIAEEEHRSLDGIEALEQDEERHRELVSGLDLRRGVWRGIGQERLRKPGSDV